MRSAPPAPRPAPADAGPPSGRTPPLRPGPPVEPLSVGLPAVSRRFPDGGQGRGDAVAPGALRLGHALTSPAATPDRRGRSRHEIRRREALRLEVVAHGHEE